MHGSRNGREAGSPIHTGRAAWWWRTIGGASSCTGGLAGRNTIFAWHTKSSSSEASAQPLGPISVFYLPTIHPALSLSPSLFHFQSRTLGAALSLALSRVLHSSRRRRHTGAAAAAKQCARRDEGIVEFTPRGVLLAV